MSSPIEPRKGDEPNFEAQWRAEVLQRIRGGADVVAPPAVEIVDAMRAERHEQMGR